MKLRQKLEPNINLIFKHIGQYLTNEVEIALSPQAHCDQPDHLVEGHASVDDEVGRGHGRHVGVHLLVHQPEGQRLVPYQRLVVALRVRDALLPVPPVGQGVTDLPHLPVVVRNLFQMLEDNNHT